MVQRKRVLECLSKPLLPGRTPSVKTSLLICTLQLRDYFMNSQITKNKNKNQTSYFLCVFSGTLSQIEMVTSGPKEGTVSGSLLLTCTVKGALLDSPYYDWNCVRLSPGGQLQFLGWIYPFGNNTGYAPSFQDRVTISADKAKNKVSLQLRTLSATDRATYFCARQHT